MDNRKYLMQIKSVHKVRSVQGEPLAIGRVESSLLTQKAVHRCTARNRESFKPALPALCLCAKLR